jgi:hypothetical protein
MKVKVLCWIFVLQCASFVAAQTGPAAQSDIDPLALRVLATVTDPIHHANSYSFRALVSNEKLGTNGQIITLFHVTEVTVQKPDKLRLNVLGVGQKVELFYNAGQTTLYSPDSHLYTTISSPKTIDSTLDDLESKDIFVPIRNFLASDPYKSLSDGLKSGYVVGQVKLFDQEVHQLAFTEPDAEWQLWVVGGDEPRVIRLEVVNKSKPFHPRTVVQFSEWNLKPDITPATFTFTKPAGAQQIELEKAAAEK